jgi:hypothetical protein
VVVPNYPDPTYIYGVAAAAAAVYRLKMTTFIYRCPATGLNVQGLFVDSQPAASGHAFESMTCTACGRTHLVDPKTGKVLGDTRK